MRTESQAVMSAAPSIDPLSMRQLTEVLIRHHGLTEGLFDLLVEFQIGTGAVGPDKDRLLPGAMIGLARVGLSPAKVRGPNTLDAAELQSKLSESASSRPKSKKR
jgi:hypothetical protein